MVAVGGQGVPVLALLPRRTTRRGATPPTTEPGHAQPRPRDQSATVESLRQQRHAYREEIGRLRADNCALDQLARRLGAERTDNVTGPRASSATCPRPEQALPPGLLASQVKRTVIIPALDEAQQRPWHLSSSAPARSATGHLGHRVKLGGGAVGHRPHELHRRHPWLPAQARTNHLR
jgi:hypothetical protein